VGGSPVPRRNVPPLFLVHMFPIGQLPVAADRPSTQLPAPPPEVDYVVGGRFSPADHPEFGLVEDVQAFTNVHARLRRTALPPADPAPEELLDGYEPFGGMTEQQWNRRYLGGVRGSVPEYAWPPGDLHPEGGHDVGEPIVLGEGTLIDRFGTDHGRIFAPAGTPFAGRSLPPAVVTSGYRRYRVRRRLPLWRTVSAAWFGQPGGGVRYRATHSADELVTMGYLECG
jgi:hypothetical protein